MKGPLHDACNVLIALVTQHVVLVQERASAIGALRTLLRRVRVADVRIETILPKQGLVAARSLARPRLDIHVRGSELRISLARLGRGLCISAICNGAVQEVPCHRGGSEMAQRCYRVARQLVAASPESLNVVHLAVSVWTYRHYLRSVFAVGSHLLPRPSLSYPSCRPIRVGADDQVVLEELVWRRLPIREQILGHLADVEIAADLLLIWLGARVQGGDQAWSIVVLYGRANGKKRK